MLHRSRTTKWILVLVFMLASIAVLVAPDNPACAFGFCEGCDNQCYQEGVSLYYQCREQGGSVSECDAQEIQYYNNCTAVFCPGCPKNHHQ